MRQGYSLLGSRPLPEAGLYLTEGPPKGRYVHSLVRQVVGRVFEPPDSSRMV